MTLLAIDTSAALCAACVLDAGAVRGRVVLDLGKGHAERLMGVIDAALAQAGIGYPGLTGVAVSVGPGSFTGVRVGVATARGLALALKIPAVGVTTLEALAAEACATHPEQPVIATIDAGRDQVYLQAFDAAGDLASEPAVLATAEAVDRVREAAADTVLAGSAARMLAETSGRTFEIASEAATADIATYASIAARRLAADPAGIAAPKPLYLRGADARPQTAFALPRREGR